MTSRTPTPPIVGLFSTLGQGDSNNLFCPYGVSALLQSLLAGSAGATHDALARVLEVNSDRVIKPAPTRAGFEEALSLWTGAGFTLLPAYLQGLAALCPVSVAPLPASDPESAVNAWVSEATHGKIAALPGSIPPGVALLLVSAVYFKARWLHAFESQATKPGTFMRATGGGHFHAHETLFMDQHAHFSYCAHEDYEWIRLPYERTSIAMDVLLPRAVIEPLRFLPELIQTAHKAPPYAYGRLRLPRFRAQWADSVAAPLQDLGLAPLFSPVDADFSPMGAAPGSLWVSDIRQSVFVAVDEVGTEAAAVTYSPMAGCSMPPSVQFDFLADRPFLFALRDTQDGAVLFTGAIRQPE